MGYYRTHSLSHANAGSTAIRSAWNKVVGDLNAGGPPPPTRLVYSKSGGAEYDLGTFWENLYGAMERVTGIEFKRSLSEDPKDKTKAIQGYLTYLFKELGGKDIRVESNLDPDAQGRSFGTLRIIEKDLWGAEIKAAPGHVEIQRLIDLYPGNPAIAKALTRYVDQKDIDSFVLQKIKTMIDQKGDLSKTITAALEAQKTSLGFLASTLGPDFPK